MAPQQPQQRWTVTYQGRTCAMVCAAYLSNGAGLMMIIGLHGTTMYRYRPDRQGD